MEIVTGLRAIGVDYRTMKESTDCDILIENTLT